ncbi:MAG: NADH-quinone oxidoreductase subunit J [Opitutales bacterium]|nr:NADH-quinone oxidoreductase subunit J [Opitutales bacterium]
MNLIDFLFLVFATLSVGGGLLMIFSRHPVSAALFMIVSMVSVAGLFVLLESFFLAILQVLVYAGAVMVLFLFIIMLLDVGPEGAKSSKIKLLSGLAGIVCFGILVVFSLILVLNSVPDCSSCAGWPSLDDRNLVLGESLVFSTSVKSFGFGLFSKYMLPIQVAGFLLLAAMVGVIILSKKFVRESSLS